MHRNPVQQSPGTVHACPAGTQPWRHTAPLHPYPEQQSLPLEQAPEVRQFELHVPPGQPSAVQHSALSAQISPDERQAAIWHADPMHWNPVQHSEVAAHDSPWFLHPVCGEHVPPWH